MSSRELPQKKISRLKSFTTSFSNLFTRQPSQSVQPTTTTQPRQDPGPDAFEAFQQLTQHPQQFLRRHQLNQRGKYHGKSGPMEFSFISSGKMPGVTRKSSVTGLEVPVYRFDIIPKSQNINLQEHQTSHDFIGQHVGMEQTLSQTGPRGKPKREMETEATVSKDEPQIFPTNKLSGCSIVRKNNGVSHWRPSSSNPDDPYSKGELLQQGLEKHMPQSSIFGPKQYRTGNTHFKHFGHKDGPTPVPDTTTFMQNDSQGNLHIYSQQSMSPLGTHDWQSSVEHHILKAPRVEDTSNLPLPKKRNKTKQKPFVAFTGTGHKLGSSSSNPPRSRRLARPQAPGRVAPRGTPLGGKR